MQHLKNALNGLAGKCLLSEEMEEFIEQIRDDEIPKVCSVYEALFILALVDLSNSNIGWY